MFISTKKSLRWLSPAGLALLLFVIFGAAGSARAQDKSEDTKFAKDAASGAAMEVKLGQLAEEKGSDPSVKEFGRRMVADHSKADNKLQAIGGQEGLKLPTDMSTIDRATYMRLEVLSGQRFDQAYASAMVKDHQGDIAAFEKEADSGSDESIKHFAAATLPTLREHLKMAKQMADTVGASASVEK
jgi:putative membrane protein